MDTKYWSRFAAYLLLIIPLAVALPSLAQETTGSIQGVVKDPAGAVIPGAAVEVSSPALIAPRSMETDGAGYYRFDALPPGIYTVKATASGFRQAIQTDVILELGRRPTVHFTMEIGAVTQTVEVVSGAAVIDTTSSKALVNIPAKLIDALPKGRGYLGLLELAPGARAEPAQGGFQLDGASASENTFAIEGQETTSIVDGTQGVNPPTDFFQEVVVKTSGYEAQHGGALGGVVNAVTKRGGSDWHGAGLLYYRNDALDAGPHWVNRRTPDVSWGDDSLCPSPPCTRFSNPLEVFDAKKDDYRIVEPGFEIGGPILADRLWFYGSYIPRLVTDTRVVDITNVNALGPRAFTRTDNTHFGVGRLDWRAAETLRAYATWNYAYRRTRGTDRPGPDGKDGETNTGASVDPRSRRPDTGFVEPNTTWRLATDWTPTPTVVVSGGFGLWNTDFQDRGRPTGIRRQWQTSNVGLAGLDGTAVPSGFQELDGFQNISSNFQTLVDEFQRTSGNIDVAFTFHGAGTHTLKGGFAVNRLFNDLLGAYNTARVRFWWDRFLNANTPIEQQLCAPVIQFNVTTYGLDPAEACRGNYGYYEVYDFRNLGDAVRSFNYAFYVQDGWNLGNGVTLNLGVRFDKEYLPSYAAGPDVVSRPIEFGFGDKVSPRIGGAWDVLRNGKLKVFASYGQFYDIMKFGLPRGLFGGDYWHICSFTLDTFDVSTIAPGQNADGFTCNNGTFGATPGTFLGEEDFRIPPNTAAEIDNLIDPNLKPMRQDEYVLGGEWAVTPDIGIEVRWARKRLKRMIEDVGILGPAGEQFLITNPGEGIAEFPLADDCPTCDQLPAMPKGRREYDGVEFRFNKRYTGKWFLVASYTWSRLHGNYSGLTSTDEDLAQTFGSPTLTGRHDPNVTRYFDEQTMLFDANGNPTFGPLATDRPHTFKGFGGYRFDYKGMSTTVAANQAIYSGTPLNSRIMYLIDAPFFPWDRGVFADISIDPNTGDWILNGLQKGVRSPVFTQTDLNINHEFKLSQTNEALRLGIELNVINLFNEANVITIKDRAGRDRITEFLSFEDPTCVPGPCVSNSGQDFAKFFAGFDPIAEANAASLTLDSWYGEPLRIQDSRAVRLKLKVMF